MKKFVTYICLIAISINKGLSQYVPSVAELLAQSNHIQEQYQEGKISQYKYLTLSDSIAHLIKDQTDYDFFQKSYYLAEYKFKNNVDEMDREAVEIPMLRLRLYPYFSMSNAEYFYKFKDLHVNASHLLIKYYVKQNNIQKLIDLKVDPTFFSRVYPTLKNAIEQLGGVWDRGEILPALINPAQKN